MSDTAPPPPTGVAAIEAALATMPFSPGVYRMLDAKGDALYVGKARSLKKRVTAYTQPVRLDERLRRMVNETAAMEVITTHTEAEALLLEANLIKRLKPRFNIVLRDDKSYPWLMLTEDHPYPQIAKHRGAQVRKGSYWGPFASAWAVNQTVTAMQRVFLIRSCADTVFANRTRPCLLHQIKRCSAPCVGRISEADYRRPGRTRRRPSWAASRPRCSRNSRREMERAAEALEFEHAAAVRDRIRALTFVQGSDVVNPASLTDADVIAAWQTAGQTCVQVFFVRGGRNNGNRAFFPSHTKAEETPAVLAAFIAQFYDDKPPPPCVLVNHPLEEQDLVAEALSLKAGRKVTVLYPQRGEKHAVVQHAETNAREALERKLAESAGQAKLLEGVATLFGLPAPPERIEVYDNSHIMGTNPYGVMIVAGPEGLREGGLPQIRHPRPDRPRRRLRHDARGAATPLHPRAEGTGGRRARGRVAGPRADRRRCRPVVRRARRAERPRRAGREAGGDRQGPGPRRRPRVVPYRRPSGQRNRSNCRRATRCCTSSSACATRRTASPSPPTAPAGRRRSGSANSTRSRASAPPASARCSTISARRAG